MSDETRVKAYLTTYWLSNPSKIKPKVLVQTFPVESDITEGHFKKLLFETADAAYNNGDSRTMGQALGLMLQYLDKKKAIEAGGRKSRIKEIHHWIFEYLLDVPNISKKSLREACLVCLYPKFAKSTIYQAFREYFQKYPKKNESF